MPVNLTPHALLFTIAAVGISETAYLIQKRIAAERPVCPIGEGCETVLNSKYNRLFLGVNNEFAGLLFYTFFAAITAFMVIGVDTLDSLDDFRWTVLRSYADQKMDMVLINSYLLKYPVIPLFDFCTYLDQGLLAVRTPENG